MIKRMKYRYFSQNGEDYLLWNLSEYKETGFYVDVGAFDGVHLSNSFSFEQQGWSGICIEPHPTYFQLCKQSRPGALCLNVACVGSDDVDRTEFYVEKLGLLSGIQGDREDDIRARYKKRGLKFKGFKRITVPAATLGAILTKHVPPETEIDFISIDVEGTELEVLQGINLSQFRPRVIVIEANSEQARNSINEHMVQLNGYVEARRLPVNILYTRDAKDADALRAISVDCLFERVLHPLGKKYTAREQIYGPMIRQPTYSLQVIALVRRWILTKMLTVLGSKS